MTGCRAEAARQGWTAALALALAAAPAAAQTLPSEPPEARDPPSAPVRLTPPTRLPPPPDPPPAAPEAPAVPDAAVDTVVLTPPDPDSVGLIGEAEGGFAVSMWRGSRRALLEALLPRLPARLASPTARALAVRLLTTRAIAPAGSADGPGLLALRVERLVALGEAGLAGRLAALAPAAASDAALARAASEASFLQDDYAGACRHVERRARGSGDDYQQRARAFCLLLSGDRDRAELLVDVLRERGGAPAIFFALMESLAGGAPAGVDSLPDPSGLDLAMMRAAKAPLPADVLSSDRPSVLLAVIGNPNAGLDLRLVAAERALAYGAIDAARLSEIHDAVPDEGAAPADSGPADWGPRRRALLLRAAREAPDGEAKAAALRRVLDLAGARGGRELVLAAGLPVVEAIDPGPGLLRFAPDAAAVLGASGKPERAGAWLALAAGAGGGGEARGTAARLWAASRLAARQDGPAPADPDAYGGWLRAVDGDGADGAAEGREKAILLGALLEALGRPLAPPRWAELLAAGRSVRRAAGADVAWTRALDEAARAGRVGETVLIALLGLGHAGGGLADADAAPPAVAALRRVGLEREARALALEAAVRGGL